jgi:hypothetical protein
MSPEASMLSIQQKNSNREWRNIPVSRIINPDEDVIILGKAFRILVNDVIVYEEGNK